jgi:serine/threonine protein kinase
MKIVRTLNEQPHPSIITFQSFIITPSFVSLTFTDMTHEADIEASLGYDCYVGTLSENVDLLLTVCRRPYLPQLIPVEVPEMRAREWLHSLVSAVAFCHRRGVVHNDIKYGMLLAD